MVWLAKIGTALILPPGCIIVVTLLHRGKARWLLRGMGLLCYLFAIEPFQDLLLRPL
ncbi:hypothetical protein Holit_00424 [Hollandina sp. SP2]